ncbi:hypothetical protein M413DRAFT_14485 [Hebeloma cylindrosporum]|uniref:Uncharacterized protein n=1 Tax=Hebeloma cylindrosporum TaxID=76867 RepID=A0A0C3BU01_HEBCY|nr:hypothetical protein M413DRAFT_14485 [Hebeloma cylindrosporum h7]
MSRRCAVLTGPPVTYQPFPLPPEMPVIPRPLKRDFMSYSSTGFTIKNYRPKRPSELLAAMSEQYEEREMDRFGRPLRGGRGKKKGKAFFHAHLTWYGLEYAEDDTRDELETRLWEAMSSHPPPTLPDEVFEAEAEMRQIVTNILIQQGHTAYTSETLARLTGANSLTDEFFDHPPTFFRNHFPLGVSPQHVVVLMNVDEVAENQVWEWACDTHKLKVEKVEKDRGRGRDRGRFPDFVLGKDARRVREKAQEIRRENGAGAAGARFRPY